MTLGNNGNIIRVRGGDTHDVADLFAANTGRIRREGGSAEGYTYTFHDATIQVEEASTLNIEASCLFTDNVQRKITVEGNSTLRIGGQKTLFGIEDTTLYPPLIVNLRGDDLSIQGIPVSWHPDSAQLLVEEGSRFELLGSALIFEEGNIRMERGSEFFCRNGQIYSDGVRATDADSPRVLFRGAPDNLPSNDPADIAGVIDIDGLVAGSTIGWLQPITLDRPPDQVIRNYKATHCQFAVQFNVNTSGSVLILDSEGNRQDILFNSSAFETANEILICFAENLNGKDLTVGTKQLDRHQPWILNQFADWTYELVGTDGNPLDAIAFLKDTDNGERGFAFASGDNRAEKTYTTIIPASGTATERLITVISDRALNDNDDPRRNQGSTANAPLPPADNRRPFIGWIRKFGYFQGSLNLQPRFSVTQTYLMVRNRAVTLTQADADAVTGVTVTFHNTAVSWNGFNWSITITIDGATLDQAWQYVHSQLTKTDPFAGQPSGVSIHNIWPSRDQTDSGLYFVQYDQPQRRRGVRVITPAGDPFPGVTSMESDDESVYVPPVSVAFTIENIVAGSELVLKQGTNIIFKDDPTGTTATYTYQHTSDRRVDLFINQVGYRFFLQRGLLLGRTDQTIRVEQERATVTI